jgi:hypothetical protein
MVVLNMVGEAITQAELKIRLEAAQRRQALIDAIGTELMAQHFEITKLDTRYPEAVAKGYGIVIHSYAPPFFAGIGFWLWQSWKPTWETRDLIFHQRMVRLSDPPEVLRDKIVQCIARVNVWLKDNPKPKPWYRRLIDTISKRINR